MEGLTAKKVFDEGKIEKFFHSVGFIWILLVITLVFWTVKQPFAGVAVLCVLMGFVLFFCKDTTPVITCFVFLFLVFCDMKVTIDKKELLWILALLFPIVGFIVNIVRFKVKNFRMKGFSFAVLITLIPWMLQGIGIEGREPLRVGLCFIVSVGYTLIYTLMNLTTRGRKGYLHYLAHVFLAVGVLIMVQIVIFHIVHEDYKFKLDWLELGWGTTNPVATILAMAMATTFYFSTKTNKFSFLFIILGCVEYLMILLLQSRGVTLFATVAMPVLLGYSVIRCDKKARLGNVITVALIVVVAVAVAIFKREVIGELFNRLLSQKFDANGRTLLWEEGITVFTEHPIFGVGFDRRSAVYEELVRVTEGPVYYHSTFIQIFASMGIIGGLAYAYLYYWRYRVAFTDMNNVKFAFLVAMLIFECYCFIDTVYFQPFGYYYMLIISLFMEKELETEQATPIILCKIRRKFCIE